MYIYICTTLLLLCVFLYSIYAGPQIPCHPHDACIAGGVDILRSNMHGSLARSHHSSYYCDNNSTRDRWQWSLRQCSECLPKARAFSLSMLRSCFLLWKIGTYRVLGYSTYLHHMYVCTCQCDAPCKSRFRRIKILLFADRLAAQGPSQGHI